MYLYFSMAIIKKDIGHTTYLTTMPDAIMRKHPKSGIQPVLSRNRSLRFLSAISSILKTCFILRNMMRFELMSIPSRDRFTAKLHIHFRITRNFVLLRTNNPVSTA